MSDLRETEILKARKSLDQYMDLIGCNAPCRSYDVETLGVRKFIFSPQESDIALAASVHLKQLGFDIEPPKDGERFTVTIPKEEAKFAKFKESTDVLDQYIKGAKHPLPSVTTVYTPGKLSVPAAAEAGIKHS